MDEESELLSHLNATERRLLGPLVGRLLRAGSPGLRRALEQSGPRATARMACVNATRLYALALFVLGCLAELGRLPVLAYGLLGLAAAFMAWSFWCLYTVVGPEREFKRSRGA